MEENTKQYPQDNNNNNHNYLLFLLSHHHPHHFIIIIIIIIIVENQVNQKGRQNNIMKAFEFLTNYNQKQLKKREEGQIHVVFSVDQTDSKPSARGSLDR